jgi:phenylacetate-CoA ligase
MSFGGFIKRTVFWANDWIHGSKVRRHFNEIKLTLKNYDEGIVIQKRNLVNILNHATTFTEFYKSFKGKNFDEFPIVNKNILNQNYNAFVVNSRNIPEQETEKLHVQRTSGSTGTPLAVFQDSRKRYRRIAELKYFGEDVGFRSHEKLAQCRIWTKWQSKSKWQSFKENIIPINVSKMDDNNLKIICETIRKNKVVSMRAYASWYDKLVEYLNDGNADVKNFKTVKVAISSSEALNEVTRKRMKELAGVPIVECYANEEAGIMAQQKIDDNNYYLNHASYYFEVLKLESDKAADYGELGRIVITDLYNYAFPLIRYDTGDTAILLKGNDKSNGWDYISKLYGRRFDLVYDTRGYPIHPMNFARVLKNVPGIRQYQFIQKDRRLYLLKLNANENIVYDDVMNQVKEIVGHDAQISFEMVEDIPILASGKVKQVVNEWNRVELKEIKHIDQVKKILEDFSVVLVSLSKGKEYRNIMAEKFINHGHIISIAENEKYLGFAAFYANDKINKTAYLSMIAVHPKYQNKNIGSKLLQRIFNISLDNGMQIIKLEVNKDNTKAINFYIKNGFNIFGDSFEENVYMIKEI